MMNECPSDMSTSSPSRLRTSFIDTTSLDLSSLSAAPFESDEEGRPSCRLVCISRLFQVGGDVFYNLLSWFDIGVICCLDSAVGNVTERLLWYQYLSVMDNKAMNEYAHCNSSVRWLIDRGARATSIQFRNQHFNGREVVGINDETFLGSSDSNSLIQIPRSWVSSIREMMTERGSKSSWATATGVSSIGNGYPHLTSIDLSNCVSITDIGVSAIAYGCPHLTSIDLSDCGSITDIGLSYLRRKYPSVRISFR